MSVCLNRWNAWVPIRFSRASPSPPTNMAGRSSVKRSHAPAVSESRSPQPLQGLQTVKSKQLFHRAETDTKTNAGAGVQQGGNSLGQGLHSLPMHRNAPESSASMNVDDL